MTTRTLSNTFKQAAFAQETGIAFILLLTISHPDFTDDIRLTSDPYELLPVAGVRGVISRGDEYVYLPFSVSLPVQDDTGIARASISIDNISREIVDHIRRVTSSLNIKMEIVLSSDVNAPEMSIENFKLERVSYDAFTVTGDISVEYFDLEPFPVQRFTPSYFPGIF